MRYILALSLLLSLTQAGFAQLSGSLSGTLGPGVYTVIGDIGVESRDTLRILPGTTFNFLGRYSFGILGTLLAEGTESDSIIFTTDTIANPGRWPGLRFMDSSSSGSRLAYCLIEYGQAYNGGGVHCRESSSPNFTHCTIRRNSADENGGGIYCYDAFPVFTNCTISGNSAGFGGGVHCYDAFPTFEGCTISNNSSPYGGIWWEGQANFTDCKIIGNSGTGVYCNYAMGVFVNCVVRGNTGGAVVCEGGALSFDHCSLISNGGTGVYCLFSTPTFNSTIIAYSQGRGIYFTSYTSSSRIEYCDFFANSGGDFFCEEPDSCAPPGIGIMDTINANGDACDIYSNIFLSPHFVDFPSYDLHLDNLSWCLGAADPANPPPTDIEGNPRPNPAGSNPDIGAYESEFATPPEGLCGALSGILGPGTFHVTCRISVNAGDTLRLMPGTIFAFEGEFAFEIEGTLLAEGTEGDSIVFTADLQGNPNRWRGLRFSGSESSTSRLAYCMIENGRASDTAPHDKGGGLYFDHASPAFTNCTIIGNSADNDGGGVYCIHSSPRFDNCTIDENTTGYSGKGGGVYCYDNSSASFTNCTISGNTAGDGGGVNCADSSPSFANCTFSGNRGRFDGGGICCESNSSAGFENCIISDNLGGLGGGVCCLQNSSPSFSYCSIIANSATSASACGGGAYCSGSSPAFTACTFAANLAGRDGGGMYCASSSPVINSTIIAFSAGVGIYFIGSPNSQLTFCDIFGNSGGAIQGIGIPDTLGEIDTTNENGDSCDAFYNIFLNPMFADTAAGDYHLLAGSPCIDAGDPTLPLDPDSTIADIGAFYYHQSAAEPSAILLPTTFALYSNWPNPFNSATMIRYDVPQAGKVGLAIFNLLGQKVATLFDGQQLAGSHTIAWEASNLPSGIYFCRMEAAGFAQTRKMLLVK